MKLHEIIRTFDIGKDAILLDIIVPYKKSLLTYYRNYYNSEPAAIITSTSNACQYAILSPINEIYDSIYNYDPELTDEDIEAFYIIPLEQL